MAAKRNTALEQLRQVALARQRAANRKVSRLKAKGVKLEGSKYDIRRPTENIGRYNTRQLSEYIGRLNNFVDRKNSFVPDMHGRPIESKVWRRYQQMERKHNKTVNTAFDKVKDIPVPAPPGAESETIEQRQARVTPKHKHVGNTTNSPYQPIERKSKNFTSEKNLKKLTAKYKQKLSGDFLAKDLRTDRRVARKMSKSMMRPDIQKRLRALTDEQFNVLWNFWGFAAAMSLPYHIVKQGLSDGEKQEKEWYEKNIDENLAEGLRLLGHAETLKLGS